MKANKNFVNLIVQSPIIKKLESLVPKYSLVGDSIFFSTDQFPWAKELELNWQVIRQELDSVLQYTNELPNFQDIMPRQQNITQDDGWKTYYFYAFGFKAEKSCQRCPETWKLLKEIPGLKVAFFSVLSPRKHIPEHRGKHKGLIRYHLGLIVPEPKSACRIRICDEIAYWQEGKSLIFDDTFAHEVWNDTDGYRVVLFLDIARPFRFPFSVINWLVCQILTLSPLVQEAKSNYKSWESEFEKIMK
ncbi:aspartyl/asparaginyl beta-hydroxylase domain-containing protein [Nostoc sp. WHI]|uniref:aspartyl/asparaginyl beta-hydroxylase domain-containing protein n=1 Tax=Nostoc sp. WHI TaxID=2650611 RepID=UPI0018C6C3F5|nr:aspartyl/asparaginyl beta-hydroxylase domain-containing protein [Nostoc sp. WHI]MBG1271894.1 aspartyl/asparaginyl beta-hydroxylase domain-containing protein [Nostoc sp. WHI]